jgi:hypothetical protein
MLLKWRHYIERAKLQMIDFSEVMALFNRFLGGIWNAIVNEDEWSENWDSSSSSWRGRNR